MGSLSSDCSKTPSEHLEEAVSAEALAMAVAVSALSRSVEADDQAKSFLVAEAPRHQAGVAQTTEVELDWAVACITQAAQCLVPWPAALEGAKILHTHTT